MVALKSDTRAGEARATARDLTQKGQRSGQIYLTPICEVRQPQSDPPPPDLTSDLELTVSLDYACRQLAAEWVAHYKAILPIVSGDPKLFTYFFLRFTLAQRMAGEGDSHDR